MDSILSGKVYRTVQDDRSVLVETIYPSLSFPGSWITRRVGDGLTFIIPAERLRTVRSVDTSDAADGGEWSEIVNSTADARSAIKSR